MVSYFVREPLSGEECNRLVNACETFREKLVVWSLLDMGLQVSEFCDLRRKDNQTAVMPITKLHRAFWEHFWEHYH